VYSAYLKDEKNNILCSFWLIATNQSLSIWSSLPYSLFNKKKNDLLQETFNWNQVEKALNSLYSIIDWVDENNFHNRFAYHRSITVEQRESFTFSLDYRAIHLHPNIIFCCPEINDYHFHRYQQELDASIVSKPHRFMAKKKSTTRKQFENLLENGDEDAKQWYVEHYNEINSFDMTKDEYLTIVFAFDGRGELVALVFNKGSWMV
jgi:hypothetical protein